MRTSDITEETIIYAASYASPDCDALGTVIGFSPSKVDARVVQESRWAQEYASEQCEITDSDGNTRKAEPEDFPMWITYAQEYRLGDIVRVLDTDWIHDLARNGTTHI